MHQKDIPLGKNSSYVEEYTPSLLFPIPRAQGRGKMAMPPFRGFDLWRAYELTFLAPNGLPQCYMASIKVPCTSPYIVESKSLKLYLGSFSQTMFNGPDEVSSVISQDLNQLLNTEVKVKLYELNSSSMPLVDTSDLILENDPSLADVKFKTFEVDSSLLRLANKKENISETVSTNLFRSRCPVTAQPDYATVTISYSGEKIDHASLLAYLVSYRRHQGFHEQCCEMIFTDLINICKCDELTVSCSFTRRGGIDINPVRSNAHSFDEPKRTPRQ